MSDWYTAKDELVDFHNLSQGAAGVEGTSCIFDDEPSFGRLFDAITKALYIGNAILVYEPGTMPQLVLAEYARWAMNKGFPFLSGTQFVWSSFARVPNRHFSRRFLDHLECLANSGCNLVVSLDSVAHAFSSHSTYEEHLASPVLQRRFPLIVLLSVDEWRQITAGDWINHGQWTVLEAPEPSAALSMLIASRYTRGLEARYQLQVEDNAIKTAIALTEQYILTAKLPGKAIKVIEAACRNVEYGKTQLRHDPRSVDQSDILSVIHEATGVSQSEFLTDSEHVDYRQCLGREIFGQDEALEEIDRELQLIRAGLTDRTKPASVMMFIGQTGTGKTEVAKALAQLYAGSRRLKVYTLGNFSEAHSVSGLIGVPAGYVGHDQGGRLINDLIADANAVILLDEADKAHPDVLQPLLNLFDEGWITDQRGVRAHASRAIFILTTNVGQRMIGELARQGKSGNDISVRMKESLSQLRHAKSNRPVFAPEFLARVKRLIVFMPLSHEAMEKICRARLRRVCETWKTRTAKDIRIDESLVRGISKLAFEADQKADGREGGRIVWKLVADHFESPLLNAVAQRSNEFKESTSIEVSLERVTFE